MQVVVDRLESTSDLHAHLSPSTMSRLQIDEDDIIKIASPARKFIIVAVSSKGFHGSDNSICIGRNFRQLLECYLGETVTIEPYKYCQAATKVVFAPISDTMNSISGNFLNVIKKSGFDFTNIPVWKDMVIPVYAMQHVFEFRVVECQPIFAVIITDPEIIQCQNEAVERVKSPVFDKLCYDDIGGIDSQLLTIRKLVENPRTSSALIVAPSGCGKTFLSQAIRNETKSHFEFIPALQLLGLKYEKGKNLLARVLEVTAQNTPAIVYIDDIDSIAGIQNYDGEEPDDRLINSFSDFIDHLRKMPNVLILATSKSIDDLRSDFHPPTCFNEAIKIDIPTKAERASILRAITRKMTLTSSNAIDDMASMTDGQTPSDLLLICKRTILSHIKELISNFDINNPYVRLDDLHEVAVGQNVYSSSTSSRNKKKKNKTKDGSQKQSRINNLDPFSDILSQQNNDNSSSDDDDNDNDNDDDNHMFPINNNSNPNTGINPNNRGSLNPFNTSAQQGDMGDKNDGDSMFGFGINPQKDQAGSNSNTADIFGAVPTDNSNDPFASQKAADPFSVPGVGSTTGFPMNDPFSTPSGSGTASAAAAAMFGASNTYGSQSGGHHKKRDGEEKKHKKHKKHNKGSKREESSNSNNNNNNSSVLAPSSSNVPQNPFNTVAQNNDPFARSTTTTAAAAAASNSKNSSADPFAKNLADPFARSTSSTSKASVDPFADPQTSSIAADPFARSTSSTSKGSVDPFADPFSSSSPSPAQKKAMVSQNSDPFAAESKKRPANEDPFSSVAAMPRNPNRANNSDPFAQSGGNKELSSNASDPFAPVLRRGGRTSDPFAPSSVRNKAARESIDPFAPPSKK